MKLLCLNLWEGGQLKSEITDFFRTGWDDVDIFCFQEAYPQCREYLSRFLTTHDEYVSAKYVSPQFRAVQMTLIRKSMHVEAIESALSEIPRTGHSLDVTMRVGTDTYWISNVHGVSRPGDKYDTPERIAASEALIAAGKSKDGIKRIIIGDFNLRETSQSVALFSQRGFRNLIAEYNVSTTRNHHIWDKFPDDVQLHSDYVFVSPEITVKHFEVLPDIVSDHQPLLLEIA
jgi:endonuclease/exonuclease/phosphatase (EEP) superfamily protein YafD